MPDRVWTFNQGVEDFEEDDVLEMSVEISELFDPPFEVEEEVTDPIEASEGNVRFATMRIGAVGHCYNIAFRAVGEDAEADYSIAVTLDGLDEGKELSLRWSKEKDALSGVLNYAFVVSASAPSSTVEEMDQYLARKLRARSGR